MLGGGFNPKDGKCNDPAATSHTRAYYKCWHQFQMKGNLLLEVSEEQGSNQQIEQIVFPAGWRRLVWEEYHDAGHLAGAKTLSLSQRKFYWPGLRDQLQSVLVPAPTTRGKGPFELYCYLSPHGISAG